MWSKARQPPTGCAANLRNAIGTREVDGLALELFHPDASFRSEQSVLNERHAVRIIVSASIKQLLDNQNISVLVRLTGSNRCCQVPAVQSLLHIKR